MPDDGDRVDELLERVQDLERDELLRLAAELPEAMIHANPEDKPDGLMSIHAIAHDGQIYLVPAWWVAEDQGDTLQSGLASAAIAHLACQMGGAHGVRVPDVLADNGYAPTDPPGPNAGADVDVGDAPEVA